MKIGKEKDEDCGMSKKGSKLDNISSCTARALAIIKVAKESV